MTRLAPYLAIAAALALGVALSLFSGTTTISDSASQRAATSTVEVIPSPSFPLLTLPELSPALSASTSVASKAAATTSTETKVPATHETAPAPVASAPAASAPAAPAPAPAAVSSDAELNQSATDLRAALVNVICYAPGGSGLHSISGSGIIVSPSGLILTNAHVAQYLLLIDQNVSCTIRTGSPAHDAYTADLAFISPAWVHANANLITEAAPSGTGEHDYAFLAIAGSVTDVPLPASFPYMPVSAYPPGAGTSVVIASYGAQFLETNQIQSSLFPTIVFGSVKDVYTFATNTIDVLALGGSAAAQEGSSGGGVASASGALVGTITTSTISGSTASRSLDAITTSYVRAAYASETGKPLEFLLSESTTTAVADFASSASALESVILSAIGR